MHVDHWGHEEDWPVWRGGRGTSCSRCQASREVASVVCKKMVYDFVPAYASAEESDYRERAGAAVEGVKVGRTEVASAGQRRA